jgi:DNA-binding beta-propeller fold protein YncE
VSGVRSRGERPFRFLAFPVLAGLLAACSGDVIGEFPSPPPPAITASPTPQLDEGILAEIAVDGSPCYVAEAGGRVWVTAFDGNELVEIDPATNEVVRTYRMPGGPCGMVERDGMLWIETQNAAALVAFDPKRGEMIDRLRIIGGVFGVTSTPSGLWAVAAQAEQVVQIDPDSRRVVARVDIEGPLGGLAVNGDQIWTVAARSELVRIDPRSHTIADRIQLESYEPEGLAIDENFLWVSSSFEGNVLRVDLRTGKVRDRVPVDGSLFGGIVIGDSYWVSGSDGTIYRLDTGSGEVVDQLELVGFGPVPAAGNLWTVDFVSNTVYRLDEDAG